ncbi:MAG: hypothetical protein JZU63_08295, partial [Rhodoferax sp.]|nr:hypothetical protein [Rhodoferax sp.]
MNEVKEQSMERLLEEEDRIAASLTKTAQRVKIEMGHTWNLRFLPVEMGPDKAYYVRLAQHWRNNRPVTCPKLTPMYMGGSLDASCPVCDVHEKYNEGGTEEARDIAYKAKCVLRYRMWCVVFDKENSRGVIDEMTDDEILIPWEFDMYKTTWEDFRK